MVSKSRRTLSSMQPKFEIEGVLGGKFLVYERPTGGYRFVILDSKSAKPASILITAEQIKWVKGRL